MVPEYGFAAPESYDTFGCLEFLLSVMLRNGVAIHASEAKSLNVPTAVWVAPSSEWFHVSSVFFIMTGLEHGPGNHTRPTQRYGRRYVHLFPRMRALLV